MDRARAVGIDLGTTCSAAAVGLAAGWLVLHWLRPEQFPPPW